MPDQGNETGLHRMTVCGEAGQNMVPPEHAGHVALYRQMLAIRLAEQACARLFAEGAIPGFIHLSIGQEAVSAGIMSALTHADTIASTHRGHGHALAKGLTLTGFFHELMGRTEGVCGGRGGSMHVADLSVGMLGANGIVGGGIAIALGSGLAQKLRRNNAIAVAFFGDGAMAEGVLHESLNIASLLSVPVLFACEANGWSEFSPAGAQIAFSLEALACAYKIPYRRIDSHDVRAIAAEAAAIVGDMRARVGPCVIECVTHRVRGHFEGDPQRYRGDQDKYVDPLAFARAALAGDGVKPALLDQIDADVAAEIDSAILLATQSTIAKFDAARAGVYASDIAA